jgi:DNA-binding beta-propeller fold protein YncE
MSPAFLFLVAQSMRGLSGRIETFVKGLMLRSYFVVSSLASLLAFGCGDNGSQLSPDAASGIDAPLAVDAAPHVQSAYVVSGNFSTTGTLARINTTTNVVDKNLAAGAVSSDPAMRLVGGELFIVNRATNNLTILDVATLAVKFQVSTGASSNPQDSAVAGNKIYIPALGTKGVVVVTRGSQTTTTIDLSDLDGFDSKPDCNSAIVVGTKLFVACGALKTVGPSTTAQIGKIVVIDTTTDLRVTSFDLPFKNPFGQLLRSPVGSAFAGDVLAATVPDFGDQTVGCVARFSPSVATPVATCALTNVVLGANPSQMALSADGKSLFVTPQNFAGTAPLRRVDLTTGMVVNGSLSAAGQQIGDIAACPDGKIIAAETKFGASGIRIFSTTAEQTTTPLDIGLPPIGGGGLACF